MMFDEPSLLWIFFDFVIIVAIPLPTEGVKFSPETGNDANASCFPCWPSSYDFYIT